MCLCSCLKASVTNHSSCFSCSNSSSKPSLESPITTTGHTLPAAVQPVQPTSVSLLSLIWLLHLLSYSHALLRNSSSLLVVPPQFCLWEFVWVRAKSTLSLLTEFITTKCYWLYGAHVICQSKTNEVLCPGSFKRQYGHVVFKFSCLMFIYSHLWMFFRENDPSWAIEIQDDVIEECNKHGGIVHIYVDKNSAQVSWSSVFARSYQLTRVSSDFTFLCLI